MDKNLVYIIYIRKSQKSKDKQALSIDAQRKELREFANKNKLRVVRVLKESQSAYEPGRPVFAEMMKLIDRGLANAVLVWKPDRIARNALDGGQFIQAMDEGKILELRTPYERLKKEDNRLMMYIHFGMSNDYSRQISANVKRGNREKYRRGEFVGKAPLGYKNVKVKESRNIKIDKYKGPLVKAVFEEYATGKYSVMEMVRLCWEKGLTSVFGNKLARSEVYALLKRTAYYGVFRHAGEYHKGSYEPLISKELFDRVQEVLIDKQKPRKHEWEHEFKGLIKCGECGCSITATTKRKFYKGTNRTADYHYYHCTKRRGMCNQRAIKPEELSLMIGGNLKKIAITDEVWSLGMKLLEAKKVDWIEEEKRVIEGQKRELKLVKARLKKLLEMRLNDEITLEEYLSVKDGLVQEQVNLEDSLANDYRHNRHDLRLKSMVFRPDLPRDLLSDNQVRKVSRFEAGIKNLEMARLAHKIFEDGDSNERRKIVSVVGGNLKLKDGKLDFEFKKPFDVLLNPEVRENVQAC